MSAVTVLRSNFSVIVYLPCDLVIEYLWHGKIMVLPALRLIRSLIPNELTAYALVVRLKI